MTAEQLDNLNFRSINNMLLQFLSGLFILLNKDKANFIVKYILAGTFGDLTFVTASL